MSARLGWHFAAADWRLGYGDGREVKVGQTYTVDGPPILCDHGLHASRRIIDALAYAPGPVICRVRLGGEIIHGDDKSVATERTVLAAIDGTDVLRRYACRCALDVLHLWHAPPLVVRYLNTGDESIRAAARDAAWDAASAAAWAAAQAAAWAATRAIARDAAWDAARDAAGAAARAAAWVASWDAGAARAKQNRRLTAMVCAAMKGAKP